MSPHARDETASAPDLGSLEAITEAVAGGAGLPEIVRAAARALDASLVLIDRTSVVLAVAARSRPTGSSASSCASRTRSSVSCGCAGGRDRRTRRCCGS
jgi:hypothetical protein